MKKIILFIAICLCSQSLIAQYVAPNQLSKVFNLWRGTDLDALNNYINSINPYWTLDRSATKIEESDREFSWLYIKQPYQFAMILVTTIKRGGIYVDHANFITDDLTFYNEYLAAIQASSYTLVNKSRTVDGGLQTVYKDGDIFYMLSIDPPNSQGHILYTLTIQGNNSN